MSAHINSTDLGFLKKIKFRSQNRKPIPIKVYGIGYTFERPGCYCTECLKLFRREGDQFDPCDCEHIPDEIIFNKFGGIIHK